MTTTTHAISTLPAQRAAVKVLHLPSGIDLTRRPAGQHAHPAPCHDESHWDAEVEAFFSPLRPTPQHGRRCACCRPALQDAEVAS